MSVHLFLGEGNFSFSTCIALSPNFSSLNTIIVATDFIPEMINVLMDKVDSEKETSTVPEAKLKKERSSLLKENVSTLKSLGHTVLLDVDATKIHRNDKIINICKKPGISRISVIFNFPHVKCKKMKIGLNRDLLRDFFKSCDDLAHVLNGDKLKANCEKFSIEVVPIVSLRAGQSGIPEVDQVSREWGDSWQINEMAAHGNFVCVNISNFQDWELFKLCNRNDKDSLQEGQVPGGYQSCYYKLLGGVGFPIVNALTLTYQHRDHINPNEINRLQPIFFQWKPNHSVDVVKDFLQVFSPILEEKVIFTEKEFKVDNLSDEVNVKRNYNHMITIAYDCNKIENVILNYLTKDNTQTVEYLVEVMNKKICIKNLINDEIVVVGQFRDDRKVIELLVDILIELKFKKDYRSILSKAFSNYKGESLYPRTHEFHISFWITPQLTRELFLETLLDVFGLMVKTVELAEEYTNEQGRKSLCWRIQVQSLVSALSRQCTHQMYLTLTQELSQRFQTEAR